MNKNIPFPLAIITILLVIAIIIGAAFWLCPEKETVLPQDETTDWQTYSNPEAKFTFKYPKDWKIIEDYFYETAAGVKSEKRTVSLQKIGDNDSNNWIRINPRQFQCNIGICVETDNNTVATYSKESATQDIFYQIFSTLRFIENETADWQTYRNEEYGFEFKYETGEIKEFDNISESQNLWRAIIQLDFGEYYIAFHGIPVSYPGEKDIEIKKDQILINNKLTIRKNWYFSEISEIEDFSSILLDYPQDEMYPYFLIYHSNKPEGLEIINKILSTFRFEEPETGQEPPIPPITIDPVEDLVKCTFLNSDTEQECFPSSHGISCSGINNCDAKIIYWGADFPEHDISSDIGKEIIWTSSCGGNISMIIGEHQWGEELVFDCRNETAEGFCGWSTYGNCLSDLDCLIGGCSSEVCGSRNGEPFNTICLWRDCYDSQVYGAECKCVENKCQWIE